MSTDHSVVQELVDSGMITEAEALVHPERHIVTRALGGPDALDPDLFRVSPVDAVRVLLCSDGITGMLPDSEIEADPRRVTTIRAWLPTGSSRLPTTPAASTTRR